PPSSSSLRSSLSAGAAPTRCRRSSKTTPVALTSTASAAFQPKVEAMNALSQSQVAATISTGGAANAVSVPPIETLTNRTPRAAYLSGSGISGRNTSGASISAASVIAAGSVTSEPSSGTAARQSHASATSVRTGTSRARAPTPARIESSTGRDAAMTMTTTTNSGSVYLRLSAYSIAGAGPATTAIVATST